MDMVINMNTAIYSKGILIKDKSKILKLYFTNSFILGNYMIITFYLLKYKINIL
jgi:hypothetical protein